MEKKELVVDKNMMFFADKNIYTKLILKKNVNVGSFPNVEEVVYDFDTDNNNINLGNATKVVFTKNESLGYKKIQYKKNGQKKTGYIKNPIDFSNIKSIEISNVTTAIYYNILENATNLEEIIFNISSNNSIYYKDEENRYNSHYLIVRNTKLKRIIIKSNTWSHSINLKCTPNSIDDLDFSYDLISLSVQYGNSNNEYKIINGKLYETKTLNRIDDESVIDGNFYIPDDFTKLKINAIRTLKSIDSISLNLNLLKDTKNYDFHEYGYIITKDLKYVEVRNNNDMALFETKKYSSEKYGTIQNIKIINDNLYIVFDNFTIKIDKDGNEEKIENEKIEKQTTSEKTTNIKEEKLEFSITNCTSEQLEYYRYYKKIVEYLMDNNYIGNNKKLSEALDTVGNGLIKIFKNSK